MQPQHEQIYGESVPNRTMLNPLLFSVRHRFVCSDWCSRRGRESREADPETLTWCASIANTSGREQWVDTQGLVQVLDPETQFSAFIPTSTRVLCHNHFARSLRYVTLMIRRFCG